MNASTLHQKICSEGENRDWNFGEAQKKNPRFRLLVPTRAAISDLNKPNDCFAV